MMKMSRLQPRIQEIQKKYENDKQKQNEAIQKLQQEEGASMGCGGCLWSLLPMLILIPLYQVIRQPIVYILHESAEVTEQIIAVVKAGLPALFTENNYYDQIIASSSDNIKQFAGELAAIVANERTLEGLNFSFLGIDLGQIPTFNVFSESFKWTWNQIGGFLIPCLSAGSQVVSMWLSQRTNNSVITDENGVQDAETAKKSQAAQQTKMMMWMMPLMSLWIGFTVPAALSLYWFVGGVVSMIENQIMTNHYRKIYDAEDAVRLQRHQEQLALEAEKERIRAEKRAANPDGITENTSKKKLQQKQKAEEEAARAAAKREYAARRGIVEDEEPEKEVLSGIPERPYCKGRAYDPDRYKADDTEE
jgi:YidC/Oxa1 family membrane protein insertase